MSFAEFMEAALYDPEDGFYATPPIGERAHFVTSPHVSPAFAALLARQLADSWEVLDRPDPFHIVEVGAGDGTLARQLLQSVRGAPDLAAAIRYQAVERSHGAHVALERHGIAALESLVEAGTNLTGCILANEVLDNLPFHRLRRRAGMTTEVMVGADGDRLVEVEAEPSPEALAALAVGLREGEERPVSPEAHTLVRDLTRVLGRGYAFLFDYGFVEGETPGPVHAYRDQEVLADVLDDPGSRDVTAAVDLTAVARQAKEAGLTVWGPVPQRDVLLALGFRRWLQGVRTRQEEADRRGDARESLRLYGARSKASILIDEAKLGGVHLLALGTPGLPAPVSVLGDRETGC